MDIYELRRSMKLKCPVDAPIMRESNVFPTLETFCQTIETHRVLHQFEEDWEGYIGIASDWTSITEKKYLIVSLTECTIWCYDLDEIIHDDSNGSYGIACYVTELNSVLK